MKSIPEAILIFALLVVIAFMAVFAYDLFATKGTTISFKRVEKREFVPPVEKVENKFEIYSGVDLWKNKVKIEFEPTQADFEALIKQQQKILSTEPNNIDALYSLGILYFMLEQHSLANKYFNTVIRLDQSHQSAKLAQVYVYYYAGEKKRAIDLLNNYIEKYPDNVDYLNCQGVLYSLLGDKKEARDYFSRAVQKQPTNQFAKQSLITLSK